jgi:membrane-bound metal-dependent hydrolase YbcI (DUF457 family)
VVAFFLEFNFRDTILDILTHTLSGMAVASAAACVLYSQPKQRFQLLALGALAGALPDLDAISMWSGFDSTFGHWFALQQNGRSIYSGTLWYSHHGFMHSLLASVFIPTTFIFVMSCIRRQMPSAHIWTLGAVFALAYNAHLAGDMPTPGGSWKGIAYFFPSSMYVGGSGATWWWNNYDVFLIVLLCVVANVILFFALRRKNYFGAGMLAVAFFLASYQLNSRGFDFNSAQY